MASRDRCPKPTPQGAEIPRITGQRLGSASVTRGNVAGSHTPGNNAPETRLAGWRDSQRRTSLRGRFPANRENNREFYENRAVWRKIVGKNAAKSVSCRAIPYKMKQGINSRRTGNLLSRAGNLLRLTGNCPPCAGISGSSARES